jgi:predicted nucleotidyltransferase
MLPQPPESGCVVARAVTHLPATKQQQLCAIVHIIRGTATVDRVILYGSHARGDWVEDPATGYFSDFDLAVLVASPALATDETLWADCHDRARDVAGDTPVSLIVHTVDDVREQLARGSSFFRDVMTEGVALYDVGRVAIAVRSSRRPCTTRLLMRPSGATSSMQPSSTTASDATSRTAHLPSRRSSFTRSLRRSARRCL